MPSRRPHPDVVRLVQRFEAAGVPPYESLSVADARLALEEVTRLQKPAPAVADVSDIRIPGAATPLRGRVYHPDPGRRLPLVVYVHGGGWTLGSIDACDQPCRRLCHAGDCVVASFDYRLAPETQFPGPLEDCMSAVRWLAANAAALGAEPGSLVMLGDSAGGNLAAATALRFRDTDGPRIDAQILLYPCLHPAQDSPFESYVEQAEAPLMSRATLAWFWGNYLGRPEDADDPLAAPLKAKRFAGLPPTWILLAELDPLRDEGLAYAEKLRAAGVAASSRVFEGAVHGFWWMDAALSQATELDDALGDIIRGLPARPGITKTSERQPGEQTNA